MSFSCVWEVWYLFLQPSNYTPPPHTHHNLAHSALWEGGSFPLLSERSLRNIMSQFPQQGCSALPFCLMHSFPVQKQELDKTEKGHGWISSISKKETLFKLSSKEQNLQKVYRPLWKQTQDCAPNQLTMSLLTCARCWTPTKLDCISVGHIVSGPQQRYFI